MAFLQHLVNGLSVGSIYALIALGYTMVFGVLRLINFAHGDVYMLGAFLGFYGARGLGLTSSPSLGTLLITLALAMTGCALAGFCIERFAYRPMSRAPRINVLITAVGVSMLLEFSGQLLFGADPKFFPTLYKPGFDLSFGEVRVNSLQVLVLGISVILMICLHSIVFHTRTGLGMRAVSFNHDLASLMGIPTRRVISQTFILGSALAGAAGVLVAMSYPKIEPMMGVMPGLKAFVAAVVGGVGHIGGAVLGALILGLAEEFVVGYGSTAFRDALAFGLLIGVLLMRPNGLLGKREAEKV